MELIMSICLLASPDACKVETLSLSGEKPSQCIMEAPAIIAEWVETHPKWKVVKWRCGVQDNGEDI
ncbi:hypothetical protein [Ancylobacter oerskovii]|uniref:DUF1482 family protein n=1 Tax=Ancylobacter oerskovii TaxID=459519 RepID=A0ABW4YUM3_9HYPH|nr:hypothetical protein [Ancylobacter oerskovii]MBS7544666.1 hypothetical protein [Ancylobacter oerskovii]